MNRVYLAGILSLIVFLVACDDDGSSSFSYVGEPSSQTGNGIDTVSNMFALGRCSEENEGKRIFVQEDAEVFHCDGSMWNIGEPEESSSSKTSSKAKSSSSQKASSNEDGSSSSKKSSSSIKSSSDQESSSSKDDSKSSSSKENSKSSSSKEDAQSSAGTSSSAEKPKSSSSEVSSSSVESSSSEESSSSVECTKEDTDTSIVDRRDCQEYKFKKIGSQVWLAENLNYDAPESTCSDQRLGEGCKKIWGRLYTWLSAVGKVDECTYNDSCGITGMIQGACPEGWHVPSYTEWQTLEAYAGGGTRLKSRDDWYVSNLSDEKPSDRDWYGFCAWPVISSLVSSYGYSAYFWLSTEGFERGKAWFVELGHGVNTVTHSTVRKDYKFSVRCLKDYEEE